ncbi:MAG: lipoprotein-releasing system transmembrane subunit, LolC/LolE family [Proteobacteria bacterium]|nr:MAG: lipoprotein-releasing system transmembrane subunit, LolC/LolE family [Pseudomonadota bacterium]
MPIELDIARRLSFSAEQRSFTRWVAILSATGMAVGVASLIVVLSVMNGLAGELTGRLLNAVPHVSVTATGSLAESNALSQRLQSDWPGAAASPFIKRQVMLRSFYFSAGAELTGHATDRSGTSNLTVIDGDLSALYQERYSVALGASLAQQLGVGVGEQVEVVLPQLSVTPLGPVPRYRRLRVSAIISVGASPDSTLAWTSYDTLQRLARASQPDGVQIRLADPSYARFVANQLSAQLSDTATVTTWADTNQSLFAAIRMEKVLVSILLSALIAVAAFSVVSSLTMSVSEKRSDIAALRVMGLTPARVMVSFLLHGLMLAVLGVVVGTALGLAVVVNLEGFMSGIESLFGWTLFDPDVYYIGGLPTKILATDLVAIVLGAVLLSIIAATYPAIRASRVSPVTALEDLHS